ncbi:MAG: DMT family transporter [Parachlamydiales bacterium]|nr:DMT family transporter [Candidatus Acheromyda pituitae]
MTKAFSLFGKKSAEQQEASRTLQNRAVLGVLLMIGGLALYPLADAFIKHLMGIYTVPQATFLRAITRLVPLLIATFFQGGLIKVLSTNHPKRHLVRLGVNLVYTYCFMYAFSMCSLTSIYTLSYTSPFFMIILSAVMLKESAGKEKWAAVAIGMIGVVIAMRPGSSVFEIASLIVLLGTFLGALNKILMRRLASTEHSLAIAIYPNLMMILVTLPVLFSTWQPMPWSHWGLFAIVGVITAAGQYAIAQALRYAQGSTLAPIDYSSFFWVVALDFFWWNKTVEWYTMLGAAIIVGSNLFILYCTRREEAKKTALSAAVKP